MNRRDFFKISGPMAAAPFFLNSLPLRTFATPGMLAAMDCSEVSERVLVIIQLSGGNDGINTLIPVSNYDAYANQRPKLRIPQNRIINLTGSQQEVGLHPIMRGTKEMYDKGWVNIVQAVGYERHNRSHFKSTDLWLTGGDSTPENFNLDSGWMARFMEVSYQDHLVAPASIFPDPLGIQLYGSKPSLGFHTPREHAVAINMGRQNPDRFYDLVTGVGGPLPSVFPDSEYGRELEFLSDTQRDTSRFAERISNVYNTGNNMIEYPDHRLARQLQTVSRLISGGSNTKVFLVGMGGYDTHTDQIENGDSTIGKHTNLLEELSESVKAFYDDLEALGIAERVLSVTFSEFGRKAHENDNLGTDHGTIAPMFTFGPGVEGGVIGNNVEFTDLQGGAPTNMQYDYRRIFGTLIQDWLGSNNEALSTANLEPYTPEKLPIITANSVVDPTLYHCRAGDEIPNPVSFIGEVGKKSVAQENRNTWHQVEFQRTYENPVVVLSPVSNNNTRPCVPLVRNVTGSGFEFQVAEWKYLPGNHPQEVISYMVMEAGEHVIGDGKKLIAGNMASVDHNWKAVKYSTPFDSVPVVFSQAIDFEGDAPVTSRHFGISAEGFRVRFQEEENEDKRVTKQMLSWIAIETGSSTEGYKFEAGNTGKVVNHTWYKCNFAQRYGADPVFFADMQTYGGSNAAALRYDLLSGERVDVIVQEEQSKDQEVYHIFESVGYMVFDSPGVLITYEDPLNPTPEPEVSCENTGQILWEGWHNVVGTSVAVIPVETPPDETQLLARFEAPRNLRDFYGARIRGYICPPMTGDYIFYIAADDTGELWLSTNDSPDNKQKIAEAPAWTLPGEWTKYPEKQRSQPVRLEKGSKYYVEALVKESRWMDHLAVGWLKPDDTFERPIEGKWLLPWEGTQNVVQPNQAVIGGANVNNVPPTYPGNVYADFTLNAYPKPFDREFYLAVGNPPADQAVVQVFNVSGSQALMHRSYPTYEPIRINAGEWAAGLYIVKVTVGNQVKSIKVTKR